MSDNNTTKLRFTLPVDDEALAYLISHWFTVPLKNRWQTRTGRTLKHHLRSSRRWKAQQKPRETIQQRAY